jgi:hypothetical protein
VFWGAFGVLLALLIRVFAGDTDETADANRENRSIPKGMERAVEKGLLAIRLFKMALATDPELILGDEEYMEFRKAWRLTKQMLSADEIEAFKELLRNYSG